MTERFCWSQYVEIVSLENEWIILHTRRQTITRLNEVGGEAWHILKQPSTLEDIVTEFSTRYDVPEVQLRIDVEEFLEQLKTSDLIEVF